MHNRGHDCGDTTHGGFIPLNGVAAGIRRGAGRPLFWVCVILAVGLVAGYATQPPGARATEVVRSSLRTTPDGVAALARAIERLGRHVEPRITPLADADPVRGTTVLLQPHAFPSPREVSALLNAVRAGGTLLYVPRYRVRDNRPIRWPLMDSLGILFRRRPLGETMRDEPGLEARWADHDLTAGLPEPRLVAHALGLDSRADSTASPALPLRTADTLMTVVDEDGTEWIGAAVLAAGAGRAVILSDAEPLSNEHAGDDALAVLAVRAALAHTPASDTVFFAEYHQGIRGSLTAAQVVANFFFGSPGGLALLHLVAVSLLFLAVSGTRFGRPTPATAPPDRERRSPLEHVSALGALYRKADARGTAALLLLARLARSTRRPPPHDMNEADALLRVLGPQNDTDTPLARARQALHADPIDLTAIAAGIDDHLSRSKTP